MLSCKQRRKEIIGQSNSLWIPGLCLQIKQDLVSANNIFHNFTGSTLSRTECFHGDWSWKPILFRSKNCVGQSCMIPRSWDPVTPEQHHTLGWNDQDETVVVICRQKSPAATVPWRRTWQRCGTESICWVLIAVCDYIMVWSVNQQHLIEGGPGALRPLHMFGSSIHSSIFSTKQYNCLSTFLAKRRFTVWLAGRYNNKPKVSALKNFFPLLFSPWPVKTPWVLISINESTSLGVRPMLTNKEFNSTASKEFSCYWISGWKDVTDDGTNEQHLFPSTTAFVSGWLLMNPRGKQQTLTAHGLKRVCSSQALSPKTSLCNIVFYFKIELGLKFIFNVALFHWR